MKRDHSCGFKEASLIKFFPVLILDSFFCRYHADPSGTFVRYDAKAIGSGSEGAQGELQDKYKKVCRIARVPLKWTRMRERLTDLHRTCH